MSIQEHLKIDYFKVSSLKISNKTLTRNLALQLIQLYADENKKRQSSRDVTTVECGDPPNQTQLTSCVLQFAKCSMSSLFTGRENKEDKSSFVENYKELEGCVQFCSDCIF